MGYYSDTMLEKLIQRADEMHRVEVEKLAMALYEPSGKDWLAAPRDVRIRFRQHARAMLYEYSR